ncbi:hypothetical protein [Phenylobacterium sp.]|uniref:hypothetical protein n=1 Tax=Phenylobacterium sp. TaxID=1871053 RepID=UPI00271A0E15|nr:hypothetical protein [Phenylobacterium sp.]MDO8380602.1 hypothetical protein [Phenylobacterium sp.]
MTDDALQGRAFPYNALGAMLAKPELDEAMRRSVRGAVAYYDAAPILHRNVKDVSRFLLGVVALYLDASGGLTHRRLRELSGKSGILSAGTATAVLLRLQLIGYVTRGEAPNGLPRLYKPTSVMAKAFRERMRIELESVALLEPGVRTLLDDLDDAETFGAFMAVMGEQSMQAAGAPNHDIAPFNALSLRSAGLLILFDLMMRADRGGPYPPQGEVEVSVAALARRYEVSRSHVLSVLRDIEAAGWMTRAGVDATWVLTPALGETVRIFYGITYLGLIRAAEMVAERRTDRLAG